MEFYLAVVFFYATAEPDIRYQQFHSFQRCMEHRQSVLGSYKDWMRKASTGEIPIQVTAVCVSGECGGPYCVLAKKP